jgi:hypothetical protein
MDFPRFVYKNGGPLQRAGGSYNHTLVESQKEMDVALSAGWFATLPEAIDYREPRTGPGTKQGETSDDNAPPTRAELEAKATELGIKFDARFGDKRLAELIQKALEA